MKAQISLTVFIVFQVFSLHSQDVYNCGKSNYWIIGKQNTDQYFYVKYTDSIQTTDQHNLIFVQGYYLALMDEFKADFDSTGFSEHDIIYKYIDHKVFYRNKEYETTLKLTTEIVKLPHSQTAILWFYQVPDKLNTRVDYELYISWIMENRIVSFWTPKMKEQSLQEAKKFLTKTINSLTIVYQQFDETTLCK